MHAHFLLVPSIASQKLFKILHLLKCYQIISVGLSPREMAGEERVRHHPILPAEEGYFRKRKKEGKTERERETCGGGGGGGGREMSWVERKVPSFLPMWRKSPRTVR